MPHNLILNEHQNVQVQGKEKKRWPPLPLSTLEMQKKATQALHMPGERIMKVAEELYQAGFISYPRTETDSFPPSQDLMVSLYLCLAHSQCTSDLLRHLLATLTRQLTP